MKYVFLILLLSNYVFSVSYVSEKTKQEAKNIFIEIYENKKDDKKNNTDEVYVYNVKNKDGISLINALKNIYDVKLSHIDNKVIIKSSKENLEKIKETLKSIDTKKKQVLVKISLIDTNKNLFDRLGINWKLKNESNLPQKALDFLQGKESLSNILMSSSEFLDINIDRLKEKGDIVIKNMPSILVLDGEKAVFKITNENIVSISKKENNNVFVSKEAGLIIELLAKIKENNSYEYVELSIKTEMSNFKSKSSKSQNIIETVINIKNGQNILVARLNSYSNNNIKTQNTIIADIPIIGSLFNYNTKNKSKREIFFEIEVKII